MRVQLDPTELTEAREVEVVFDVETIAQRVGELGHEVVEYYQRGERPDLAENYRHLPFIGRPKE